MFDEPVIELKPTREYVDTVLFAQSPNLFHLMDDRYDVTILLDHDQARQLFELLLPYVGAKQNG